MRYSCRSISKREHNSIVHGCADDVHFQRAIFPKGVGGSTDLRYSLLSVSSGQPAAKADFQICLKTKAAIPRKKFPFAPISHLIITTAAPSTPPESARINSPEIAFPQHGTTLGHILVHKRLVRQMEFFILAPSPSRRKYIVNAHYSNSSTPSQNLSFKLSAPVSGEPPTTANIRIAAGFMRLARLLSRAVSMRGWVLKYSS